MSIQDLGCIRTGEMSGATSSASVVKEIGTKI